MEAVYASTKNRRTIEIAQHNLMLDVPFLITTEFGTKINNRSARY